MKLSYSPIFTALLFISTGNLFANSPTNSPSPTISPTFTPVPTATPTNTPGLAVAYFNSIGTGYSQGQDWLARTTPLVVVNGPINANTNPIPPLATYGLGTGFNGTLWWSSPTWFNATPTLITTTGQITFELYTPSKFKNPNVEGILQINGSTTGGDLSILYSYQTNQIQVYYNGL